MQATPSSTVDRVADDAFFDAAEMAAAAFLARFDDRPTPVDGVRVLQVRPH
jgi:hypothetical protein